MESNTISREIASELIWIVGHQAGVEFLGVEGKPTCWNWCHNRHGSILSFSIECFPTVMHAYLCYACISVFSSVYNTHNKMNTLFLTLIPWMTIMTQYFITDKNEKQPSRVAYKENKLRATLWRWLTLTILTHSFQQLPLRVVLETHRHHLSRDQALGTCPVWHGIQ